MKLLMLLCPVLACAAITNVSVVGVTNTQAVISYTAPNGSACTVEVSESATYSPLVFDVDPAIFAGSDQDSRATSVNLGTARKFVVGARLVNTASAVNYSRALQAHTQHYFRITCGSDVETGAFMTANIPFTTRQDVPQMDPANPGYALTPTLSTTDRAQQIVDPLTGALIRLVGLPSDSGPYTYDSGFTRQCGENYVGPSNGYLCSFPENGGSAGSLYYLVPATGASTYLGRNNWGAALPLINATDNKFYTLLNNTSVRVHEYLGPYTNSTATWATPVTLVSNIGSAIQAFNPLFDIAGFPCGNASAEIGIRSLGDYVMLRCQRSGPDSYGWVISIKISTASVVAATRIDSNIQSRWCGIHNMISMYTANQSYINTHGFESGNNTIGHGPYYTTYSGGSTLPIGSTSVSVSGEPDCPTCGADPYLALAQTGDQFTWVPGGEIVTITNKVSPTSWAISATTATHAPGDTLRATCNYKPLFWDMDADPLGTDTTNTKYVADGYWGLGGGHDDITANLRLGEHWPVVVGALWPNVNTPITRTISESPLFAGARAQCYGNGCASHPSAGPSVTPSRDAEQWFTDFFQYDGAYADAGTGTNVTGQIYKYTHSGTYPPAQPKYFAIGSKSGYVGDPNGGPYSLTDISGPSSVLGDTAADQWKLCIANAPNECVTGSAKGDEYQNVPSLARLALENNFNAFANGILQIGVSGTRTRVITGGLTGLGKGNGYPNAKALQDGSWVLFPHGSDAFQPHRVLMAKLPPLVATDNVDRSKFISVTVPLTAPGGLGVDAAAIRFGYLEMGTQSQYRCTSRAETCIANSSSAPPTDGTTDPFKFETTDTWSGVSCASACSVQIPVYPGRIVYYQPIFLSGGSVVATGTAGVAGDFMAVIGAGAAVQGGKITRGGR